MSIEWITILIFGSMVLVMFLGLPVAFATGFVGIVFTAIFQGAEAVNIVPTRIFGLMTNYLLGVSGLMMILSSVTMLAAVSAVVSLKSMIGIVSPLLITHLLFSRNSWAINTWMYCSASEPLPASSTAMTSTSSSIGTLSLFVRTRSRNLSSKYQ